MSHEKRVMVNASPTYAQSHESGWVGDDALEQYELYFGQEIDTGIENLDTLGVYLRSIGKRALLNAEEEVELASKIEAGLYAKKLIEASQDSKHEYHKRWNDIKRDYDDADSMLQIVIDEGEKAKNRFIESNLRLVVPLAKRYGATSNVPLIDRIQDGNAGIVHAVEMFDYKKSFKFSTYATWWIRQAIIRQSWDQSRAIRLPTHVTEKIMNISHITKNIERDTGRPATNEEIAEQARITLDELLQLRRYNLDLVSLDAWVADDTGATVADLLVDESDMPIEMAVEIQESRNTLNEMLGTLTPFEEQVVRLKHGIDDGQERSVREIETIVNASRPKIHRTLDGAMRKMKILTENYELHDLVD